MVTFNGNTYVTVLSCYSLTNVSSEDERQAADFAKLTKSISKRNVILVGDMIAKVGETNAKGPVYNEKNQ